MTDVKVSNARRIGFTALALVAFWVVALRAYDDGVLSIMLPDLDALSEDAPRPGIPVERFAIVTVAYSILPVLFLSLSTHNSPLRSFRSTLTVVTSVLMAGTVGSSFLVGVSDLRSFTERATPHFRHTVQSAMGVPSEAPPEMAEDPATVSWVVLLLPIILTTAVVIFGAWRRAVKAREAEAEPAVADD